MRATIEDTTALRSINPAALAAYVRASGWARVESFGEHSDVYAKSGAPEIIIPGTAALADYAAAVSAILATLAAEEGRDQLQIYRDLVVADRDVIRVQAPQADDDGSIRIEAGVDLVFQARDLLLAAACSAKESRATYRAGKIKDATEYMEKVRLGQTEQGSFVVALLSPVPPNLEQNPQATFWPVPADEPFERRVTRKLVDGLVAAKKAAEGVVRGAGLSAFTSAVANGVSANSCEALATLIERGQGLEVSVTWARTRPTPETSRRVGFTSDEAAIFREAARHFRSIEPRPDERLEAYVVAADRKLEKEEGRVALRTFLDGHPVSVSAVLPKPLYSEALSAHDDKVPIAITGDLKRHGQRWQLENPRDLTVLSEESSTPDDDATGPESSAPHPDR